MKFYGRVGFWEEEAVEDPENPGSWSHQIVEHPYSGDILKENRTFKNTDQINTPFSTRSRISILSDLYAQNNWNTIRYVHWNNENWEVTSVDVNNFPRIILEIGGVWSGECAGSSEETL